MFAYALANMGSTTFVGVNCRLKKYGIYDIISEIRIKYRKY